jgi:hypothetical protein
LDPKPFGNGCGNSALDRKGNTVLLEGFEIALKSLSWHLVGFVN